MAKLEAPRHAIAGNLERRMFLDSHLAGHLPVSRKTSQSGPVLWITLWTVWIRG